MENLNPITEITEVTGIIPYPPTTNRYWITKQSRNGYSKTVTRRKEAIQYVEDVYYLIRSQQCKALTSKHLRLELYVYPPDLKKRDLDNLCKAVLDALQRAGIYGDDFYIQQLYLQRMEVKKHGEIKFILRSI